MIRLLIADDHALMRESLKRLLVLYDDIEFAGEAANGEEVTVRLQQGGVDLLLLDLQMPGISGCDLIERIRSQHPELPLLILSMHNAPWIASNALKAGANGYLAKDVDPHTLLAAVHKVARGGRFLDPAIAEKMAFESSGLGERPCLDRLSDRELQVLRLFAKGGSVNDIAETLAISNKTVSTYKTRLMEKMGFSSDANLVRYAVQNGIVE